MTGRMVLHIYMDDCQLEEVDSEITREFFLCIELGGSFKSYSLLVIFVEMGLSQYSDNE